MSVLSQPDVSRQYAKNYVSTHVDFSELAAKDPKHAVIARHNSSGIHPVLVFLDAQGKEVARVRGGFRSPEDALLLDRFVSGKHYRKMDFPAFKAAQKS
ncbi:MAG: hypothetical protein Q8L44_15010 [Sulfuritalea sp.]|nr:hypothetical protein [Sulfuritalea sp.]